MQNVQNAKDVQSTINTQYGAVSVTYTDYGVQYVANGATVTFTGESDYGEVHVSGRFEGYYVLSDDGATVSIKDDDDLTVAYFANNDNGYAEYVDWRTC